MRDDLARVIASAIPLHVALPRGGNENVAKAVLAWLAEPKQIEAMARGEWEAAARRLKASSPDVQMPVWTDASPHTRNSFQRAIADAIAALGASDAK